MKIGDKVFYTRYALTEGIREVVVTHVHTREGDGSQYLSIKPSCFCAYPGKDAFATLDEACKQADKMRHQRIKSLQKSIASLEKMDWAGATEGTP